MHASKASMDTLQCNGSDIDFLANALPAFPYARNFYVCALLMSVLLETDWYLWRILAFSVNNLVNVKPSGLSRRYSFDVAMIAGMSAGVISRHPGAGRAYPGSGAGYRIVSLLAFIVGAHVATWKPQGELYKYSRAFS